MKINPNRFVLLLLMPAFVSLASCNFLTGNEEVFDAAPVEQNTTGTIVDETAGEQPPMVATETIEFEFATATAIATATAEPVIQLGEDYRSEEGGFSFSAIPDYEISDTSGTVKMMAPDADEESGPYILMIGKIRENMELQSDSGEEMDSEDITGELNIAEAEGVHFESIEEKEIEIGGYTAQSKLLKGTAVNEPDFFGRIIMMDISDTQSFFLLATAPTERWQDELEPLVEAVIDTIEFFEPTPAEFDFDAFNEEISQDNESFDPYQSKSKIRQWGLEAYASSEYYPAMQAIGRSDTFECVESDTAWSSSNPSNRAWLEVYYQYEVYPTEINIYQTFHPSQVVLVELLDPSGNYHNVYYGTPTEEEDCPYMMTIVVEDADYEIMAVEVTVDQSSSGVWNQIDAVELIGYTDSQVPDSLLVRPGSDGKYADYRFSPDDVEPGNFTLEIGGDITASESNNLIQDHSTPHEYALDLISPDGEYLVSLFIPTDIGYELKIKEYSPYSMILAPSASVYAGSTLYYARDGFMKIEVDENGKTFSGSFSFTAYDMDDEESLITVDGAFNQFDLELMQ